MAQHAPARPNAGPATHGPGAGTLDALLAAARSGRSPAVVDGPVRLSLGDVRARAEHLAHDLATRGVRRGHVVAWQLPNGHDAVALFRACWALGAVAAPLHHRSREAEVGAQLARLAPTAVLAALGLPAADAPGAILVPGAGGETAGGPGGALPSPTAGPRPDDPAVVLFTSGTDGRPKGVVHTHRALSHKALVMAGVHGLTADDVVLMPAPLAHVSGLLNGVVLPGATGMGAVLMDRWDPARALELIEAERVTFMVGPPTFFLDLLERPECTAAAVASLRVVSCGGTGVSQAFVERASARLGARVKRSYGSTEAPTVTTWHAGDPPERAATSDGHPVGDVELRLVVHGTSDAAPPGEPGELWVRGTEVSTGYLGGVDPEAHTPDGWFRTGDLGVVDAEGWLTIVGRARDLIIRGGENVAPAEVEAALEAHPAVRQAVVVGLPDERWGEVVAAAVVSPGGFDVAACRSWCGARGLAGFKVPSRVVRVDALPRLGSGKPDRAQVRRLVAQDATEADDGAGR